jgi:hypothetical protein
MTQQHASPPAEMYIQYTIRLRKGSLAAQGISQHAQRFNCRYEAGWLATLIEEFYVLLDGSDPRASLLYPLLYHRFEPTRETPPFYPGFSQSDQEQAEESTEEHDASIDLTAVADMSKNLQGYFEEEHM